MFLIPIATLDIQDAAMRYALDKKYDNKEVFNVALQIFIIGTVVVAFGSFCVSLFNIPGLKNEYLFFLTLTFFSQAGFSTFSLYCRGIDCVKQVAVASIINSVATLTFNILFLLVFKWGLNGYLLANSIGPLIGLIYLFGAAQLFRCLKLHVSSRVRREMIGYSFPLIFGVVSWWINSAADRYIISAMYGVAISGVYAVAYKIPSILSMFGNIFSQAWSISAVNEYDLHDNDGFFGKTYTLMNFAIITVSSILTILDIPLARMLYAKEFFEAWHYVPFILLAVVFDTMSQFIGGVFTAVKDTKVISYTTIAGAAINLILNFLLIPSFGAFGAAVATAVGYGCVYITRLVAMRKYIKMKFSLFQTIVTNILLLLQICIAQFGVKSILVQCIILIIIIAIHRQELKKITALMRSYLDKVKMH